MFFLLFLLFSVECFSEISCISCNETCSPCGGGCTATDLSNMFELVSDFDATIGDITGWNTSCITSMNSLFLQSDFNQDINSWNTSQVTDMGAMFQEAISFNKSLNSWNTNSVTSMNGMFLSASSFNRDISSWDTSNVEDMGNMFDTATLFNQNISAWNVGNVINMNFMFFGAETFNSDISNWDVSKAQSFTGMFDGATSFNQNLSNWNVSQVIDMDFMFNGVTLSSENYDSLLLGWSSRVEQTGVRFSGGNSKFSEIGQVGREILNTTYLWEITDGGAVTCNYNNPPGNFPSCDFSGYDSISCNNSMDFISGTFFSCYWNESDNLCYLSDECTFSDILTCSGNYSEGGCILRSEYDCNNSFQNLIPGTLWNECIYDNGLSECKARQDYFCYEANTTTSTTTTILTTTTSSSTTSTTIPVTISSNSTLYIFSVLLPVLAAVFSILAIILAGSKGILPSVFASSFWYGAAMTSTRIRFPGDFTVSMDTKMIDPGNWEIGQFFLAFAAIMAVYTVILVLDYLYSSNKQNG